MSLPLSRLRSKASVDYRVPDESEFDDDLDAEGDVGADDDDDPDADGTARAGIDDDPDQPSDEQSFKLLNLPPELRVMIYKEALVDPDGVYLKADFIVCRIYDRVVRFIPDYKVGNKFITERSKFQISTNLLATCKQVHDEAILCVYQQPFIFDNSEAVHIFLINMRPTTISLLQKIKILEIRRRGINNTALLSGLRHATGLTDLRFGQRLTVSDVHLRYNEKRIGSEIASRFYTDAAYFIRNFVAVRGIDALLKVVKLPGGDLRGNMKKHVAHRWTKARRVAIMKGFKARLMRNLRVRADGRVEIS